MDLGSATNEHIRRHHVGHLRQGRRSRAADPATPAAPAAKAAPAPSSVDVAAIMDNLAKHSKQKPNWRKSIVDLMKLLDLDSSLDARAHLAKELHYTGNVKETATMNGWLHKQVMIKLAENGGKVPSELKQ
jgi:hypothetical protein